MEGHNIAYFRNLWQTTTSDLEDQCQVWEKICCDTVIPDEVHGEIRTTIGLGRLLMNQKLKQFKGLIDDSEFNTGEKEITCVDLEGFWDMVYFEIEKIRKCFLKLDKCKDNEWQFVEEDEGKPLKKKVHVSKDASAHSEKNNSRALAAKQRLAEAKKKMLAQRVQQKEEDFLEMDIKKVLETTQLSDKMLVKHPMSVQNKENILLCEETSNLKNISTKQTKSKGKAETVEFEKNRRKTKETVKLQCITRSAKKRMLEENAIQK